MKFLLVSTVFFLSLISCFSQEITYKSGRIYNSEMQKLKPKQVREILANNTESLRLYNKSRSKATTSSIFLCAGIGLIAGDLLSSLYGGGVDYPSPITLVGVTSVLISIPISIGTNKNARKAVENYSSKKVGYIDKTTLLVNQNGIGMQISF